MLHHTPSFPLEVGLYTIYFGLFVWACLSGGVFVGMWLSHRLPAHHLDHNSKETIKLGIGLVATMTALVLGLITASAKSFFDTQDAAVRHSSTDILNLDRLLARYGPETAEIRQAILRACEARLQNTWPSDARNAKPHDASATTRLEHIEEQISDLNPQTERQKWLRDQALTASNGLLKARWLMLGNAQNSVPLPFLAVLVLWLTLIFVSFGLFSPRNATVVGVLVVCALSVAAAIVLILELNRPLQGLMRVSGDPLRYTISHLGE